MSPVPSPQGSVSQSEKDPNPPEMQSAPRYFMDVVRSHPILLIFLFALLCLANGVLLTVQFVYTSYPLFNNLYWVCTTQATFRAMWSWRRHANPSVAPSKVPPQWVFWVMAGLTSVDAILTTVGISKLAAYGALQVLLFQTRVPVSMLFTKLLINGRKYRASHYIGAFLVVCGILVTLLPDLGAQAPGSSDILPGVVIILLDSIPSALFLVAQERILASYALDEYYLLGVNQWQNVTCTFLLIIPTALLAGIAPSEVGQNLLQGAQCQFGMTPPGDASCAAAPFATHAYILVNIIWNIVGVFVISCVGASANVLVSTATIPLNLMIFAIPGMPAYKPTTSWAACGFVFVTIGLLCFQFYRDLHENGPRWMSRVQQWWRGDAVPYQNVQSAPAVRGAFLSDPVIGPVLSARVEIADCALQKGALQGSALDYSGRAAAVEGARRTAGTSVMSCGVV